MIKTRVFPESNYKGIYFNHQTLRVALDNTKPILELEYPEFYDIKITDRCEGNCPYCYMDSTHVGNHANDIVGKIIKYFGAMTENQRPFQIAAGGGEPTGHPEFIAMLEAFHTLGITPNYTTNGMFSHEMDIININKIINATQQYCGGVAVSCHPHLEKYWMTAADLFYMNSVKLNFHIVISDRASIDRLMEIYSEWKHKVDYFVLLPYGVQGRAVKKSIEWEYLVSCLPINHKKFAFGANFYPNLVADAGRNIKVSLYEPEIMSKFIDMAGTGSMYNSSFDMAVPIKTELF